MLKYLPSDLSAASTASLNALTSRVLAHPTRAARYTLADRLFSAKRPAAAFNEVKDLLRSVSPNVEACFYCERDRHRDIDHIEPKAIHPELAFKWENYAYSCAICNQDCKRSKYAVVDTAGNIIDCHHIIGTNDNLPNGVSAFINPRLESGLDFFRLELTSGLLLIAQSLDAVQEARAKFTRDTLDLNSDGLARIRRQAFQGFIRYVQTLHDAVVAGDEHRIALLENEVSELGHPTVMVEAWRQRHELGDFGQRLEVIHDRLDLARWHGSTVAA